MLTKELILAAKELNRYIVERGYIGAVIDQIGGIKLYQNETDYEYISPVQQDYFLQQTDEEDEGEDYPEGIASKENYEKAMAKFYQSLKQLWNKPLYDKNNE